MRVLFIGGSSKIASALDRLHRERGDETTLTTRRPDRRSDRAFFDLAQPFHWAGPTDFDLVYVTGGITSLRECEENPQATGRINIAGAVAAAEFFAAKGAHIVIFSTNLVFDGTTAHVRPNATLSPRCEYGKQKAALEIEIGERQVRATTIRLTKVLDFHNPLFCQWRDALAAGYPIAPFADMVLAPITLGDVAHAVVTVASAQRGGIVQLSAADDISYANAALCLAREIEADETLVRPQMARAVLGSEAHIPAHTTLAAYGDHEVNPNGPPSPYAAVREFAVRTAVSQ